MVDDVKVATGCKIPVVSYGRSGGMSPSVKKLNSSAEFARPEVGRDTMKGSKGI